MLETYIKTYFLHIVYFPFKNSCACTEILSLYTAIISSQLCVKDFPEFKLISLKSYLHDVILNEFICQWY